MHLDDGVLLVCTRCHALEEKRAALDLDPCAEGCRGKYRRTFLSSMPAPLPFSTEGLFSKIHTAHVKQLGKVDWPLLAGPSS